MRNSLKLYAATMSAAVLAVSGCSSHSTQEEANATPAASEAASDTAAPSDVAATETPAAAPAASESAAPEAKPSATASAKPTPEAAAKPVAVAAVTPPAAFARCAVCHDAEKGGATKIGPNLWGVYGTKAGEIKGFAFSDALKNSGLKWDDATLDQWISGPMKMVPGTAMAFPGIKDPAKRAEIVAFLKQAR